MIEKSVNEEGQEQIINNADRIIKIDGQLLQVRLIKTRKFDNGRNQRGFCEPMPRARFVRRKEEDPYYLIKRSDFKKLKEKTR